MTNFIVRSSYRYIEISLYPVLTVVLWSELNGGLGERFIFRVGVFADRGMLPGLARTTALTTIAVQLRLN